MFICALVRGFWGRRACRRPEITHQTKAQSANCPMALKFLLPPAENMVFFTSQVGTWRPGSCVLKIDSKNRSAMPTGMPIRIRSQMPMVGTHAEFQHYTFTMLWCMRTGASRGSDLRIARVRFLHRYFQYLYGQIGTLPHMPHRHLI